MATAQAGPTPSDPFDPQRLSPGRGLASLPPQDLGFFEPAQLKLVGMLSSAGKRQALLLDPQHRVHRVEEGSLLGRDGWRVVRIGEAHLVLTAPLGSDAVNPAKEIHLSMEQP
jgi:hypothetical protein